jgi:hypothetical protein
MVIWITIRILFFHYFALSTAIIGYFNRRGFHGAVHRTVTAACESRTPTGPDFRRPRADSRSA